MVMRVMINMPHEIENKLQQKAERAQLSLEQVVLEILAEALEEEVIFPSPKEVVAKIKATPPGKHSLRPATGSLAELLRHTPVDLDFDLDEWNRAWRLVAAEQSAMTRANDIAEGRV